MNNLVQLVFISRPTFTSLGHETSKEPNLSHILSKSRSNNSKYGLVGVLFCGDGCFFECLEGPESEINHLYQKLLQDNRHKDLKVIHRKKIQRLSFKKWRMKYVPFDVSVKQLLQKNGFERFDPYAFDEAMTNKLLDLLLVAKDPTQTEVSGKYHLYTKWAIFLPIIIMSLYLTKLIITLTSK